MVADLTIDIKPAAAVRPFEETIEGQCSDRSIIHIHVWRGRHCAAIVVYNHASSNSAEASDKTDVGSAMVLPKEDIQDSDLQSKTISSVSPPLIWLALVASGILIGLVINRQARGHSPSVRRTELTSEERSRLLEEISHWTSEHKV